MSYTPHKYLRQALVTKLKGLGYSLSGSYPRVELYDFATTQGAEKNNVSEIVTCVIEVVDSADSPKRSLDMIEAIRAGIEDLTVSGFSVVIVEPELLTELEEYSDTDLKIYRQIQRMRFLINK